MLVGKDETRAQMLMELAQEQVDQRWKNLEYQAKK
jgi:hypothetical protein